jgi:hypothetical protein
MSECEIASVINMSEPTRSMQRGELIAPEPEKRGLYDVADGVASTMFFLMIKERESTD